MADPGHDLGPTGTRAGAGGRVLALAAGATIPPEAGGKALGLAQLLAAGLRVPPTWVVLPGASAADLDGLAATLRSLGVGSLAVRSSASGEDGAGASYAGVHASALDVPLHGLGAAVAEVEGSASLDRARAYRRARGLPDDASPVAVVVQPMLDARCSGVARGGLGASGRVVVEVVAGRGERLQEGLARPERWLVGAGTDAPAHTSGSDAPSGRLLDAGRAREIAAVVRALAEERRSVTEVEWVSGAGPVWYVQVRRVRDDAGESLPPGESWTRANLGETFPEIPSALTRSLLPRVSGAGVERLLRSCGLRVPSSTPLCACVAGRPVLNDRVYALADVLGTGADDARRHVGASTTAPAQARGVSITRLLRHPWIALRAGAVLVGAERRARRAVARLEAAASAATASPAGADPLVRAVEELDGAPVAVLEEATSAATRLVAALVWRLSAAGRAFQRRGRAAGDLARLVAGGPPTAGARRAHALAALATCVRSAPGADAWLALGRSERSDEAAWRRALDDRVMRLVTEHLRAFGHRARFESDLARPRPADDLAVLHDELVPLVGTTARAVEPNAGRSAPLDAPSGAPAGRGLPRGLVRAVARLRRMTAAREELRDRTVAYLGVLRTRLRSVARALVERGRLDAESDLWSLDVETLRAAAADPAVDLRVVVARERSRAEAWRLVRVPWNFRSEDLPFGASPSGAEAPGRPGETLRGTAAAPGLATGTVHRLDEGDPPLPPPADAVLVATRLEPGLTPLLTRAVAVVTEVGGVLSHASIVARELGVPAVTDVVDATRRLAPGTRVLVDGDRGSVTTLGLPTGG